MSVVEIRIRTFHTCSECDLAPAITFTLHADMIGRNNWPELLTKAVDSLDASMNGAPATGLRPMTRDEVREYQKSENDDTPGFIGLATFEAKNAAGAE